MNIPTLITKIIDLALEEDGPDVTSEALFDAADNLYGLITAKEDGVLAGISVAEMVFKRLDPHTEFNALIQDGQRVQAGQIVCRVRGTAQALLKGERIALNFMQRMSGIASRTALYVRELEGTGVKLLDTRKTAPGQRVLDKMAVRLGGGTNHRQGLFDMALIKDNHIDRVGSITKAVQLIRERNENVPIEVETRCLADVEEALPLNVERIMLDNFSLEDMRRAVQICARRVKLEASGGITLQTIRDVALTGVDFVSVGDVTHSVKALDLSMTIEVEHVDRSDN